MRPAIVAVVALLLLVAGLSFGAGQSDEGSASSQGPVEIRWLGLNGQDFTADAIGFQEFNKALNIKIIPDPTNHSNREQMNLLLASGDLPDHILMYQWALDQFWEEGALEPVEVSEARQTMPEYMKLLAQEHPKWQSLWYMDDKDTFKALPHASFETRHVAAIRTDWLQQLGLSQPETAADLEEIMRAFTTQDPDGNGKDDSYGIAVIQNRDTDLLWLFKSFGFSDPNEYMLDDNGAVVRAAITRNYKDALKWVQGLYEKGYIFPDITHNVDQARDLFVNNKIGIAADTWTWLVPSYRPSDWYALFFKNNPGATADMLKPVPAAGYKVRMTSSGSRAWAYSGMKTNIEPIKKQKIMEVLELQLADMYYHRVIWGGVPDVHHTLREDGKIELLPEWTPREKQDELGMKFLLMNMRVTPEMQQLSYGSDLPKIMDFQKKYYNVTEALPVDGFQSEVWKEVGADVGRIQSEFMWQAVTGKIDVEAEWDRYVQSWLKAGGQELLDEGQAAYDAAN